MASGAPLRRAQQTGSEAGRFPLLRCAAARVAILRSAILRAFRRLPLAAVCIACASSFATGIAEAGGNLESEVKAAYLSKLPAFVEWPRNAFVAPASPFNLCVVGEDPFGDLLERAVGNQRFADRPIAILHPTASQFAHCHLMFVGGDQAAAAEILSSVRGFPVLTVTDSADDKSAAGIVNFVIRDNHVRFQIDRPAATRNGLEISSKLLSIAVSDSAP